MNILTGTNRDAKLSDISEDEFSLIDPLNDYIDACIDELDIDDVYEILEEILKYYGFTYDNTIDELNSIYRMKPLIL